jgi:hypothetical protein
VSTIYRIAKWTETFETAESRRHRILTWVSLPIGFDSSGYTDLVETFGEDRRVQKVVADQNHKEPATKPSLTPRNQPQKLSP